MKFSFNVLITVLFVKVSASNFLHHPQSSDLAYTKTGFPCAFAVSRAGWTCVLNVNPCKVIFPVSSLVGLNLSVVELSDWALKHPESRTKNMIGTKIYFFKFYLTLQGV